MKEPKPWKCLIKNPKPTTQPKQTNKKTRQNHKCLMLGMRKEFKKGVDFKYYKKITFAIFMMF